MIAPPVAVAAPLECPIPSSISPYADHVQEALAGWLHRRGRSLTFDRQAFVAARFARYAARLYPDAHPTDLRSITRLFAWFFLLDDAADSTATPDPGRLSDLLTGSVAVLQGGWSADPLHRMLADAWRPLRRRMPVFWRERFIDAVRHHLLGVLVEADNKQAGHRPHVAGYIELRRATSAAYVGQTLAEFAARAPLPDALYHHPAVRAYSAAGNDLLSWFNDLLSLDRDEHTAGGHNLVLALAAERGLAMPDAVAAAADMWRERMDEFAGLRAAVPRFGGDYDIAVRRFLDGVDRAVRGTIDWSLESVRYRPPKLVASYL